MKSKTEVVTDTVWWPPEGVKTLTALVTLAPEVMISLTNLSSEPLTVGVRKVIAILDEAAVAVPGVVQTDMATDTPTEGGNELQEHLEDLYLRSTEALSGDDECREVRDLLTQYQDVFVGPEGELGMSTTCSHAINTGENDPVKQRPYRMSAEGHRIVAQECKAMLKKGVIRDSKSPWSSPMVLVTKKNGEICFCVDYRKLNTLTVIKRQLSASTHPRHPRRFGRVQVFLHNGPG
eukprot:GHVU01217736.1.p1 GENE.GHVU01217736.1~~GHVU01217736.1.p1  ORF type:complete len:235 (+),score=16.26 GHVU01217736.1:211-915(+)